jgi:hypothetical protein
MRELRVCHYLPDRRYPCSAGGAYRPSGTATIMTDAERLNDISEKLFHWGYLSSYPDAEHDVAWLLEKLGERNRRIAELKTRLRRNECIFLLP